MESVAKGCERKKAEERALGPAEHRLLLRRISMPSRFQLYMSSDHRKQNHVLIVYTNAPAENAPPWVFRSIYRRRCMIYGKADANKSLDS
jgi:hypothetical protein